VQKSFVKGPPFAHFDEKFEKAKSCETNSMNEFCMAENPKISNNLFAFAQKIFLSKCAKGGPLTNCFCTQKFGWFYILRIILGQGDATDLGMGSFDAPFKALQGSILFILAG
jgi:hypothetical protein